VPLKHASLFSGIGGFDLAAEWMGWENVFNCEINKYCQQILKQHFPKSILYDDIKKTNFKEWNGKIDIISGGFPCQPYSNAGKRKGKEDDRHLWPEMLRAIREIQPRWVVGENVSGLLNWSKGLVLDEIKADLEAAGFEVFPPLVLPACGVNAPHRRDRVWIIAHSINGGYKAGRKEETEKDGVQGISGQTMDTRKFDGTNISPITTNTDSNIGCKGWVYQAEQQETERHTGTFNARSYQRNTWENFPTQSPLCGRNDGLPTELSGITISKHRTESIKAYGNSIVPQVVYQIFKTIEQYEQLINHKTIAV
jgi:DNA (cytosine-5)-methyltransferase 1